MFKHRLHLALIIFAIVTKFSKANVFDDRPSFLKLTCRLLETLETHLKQSQKLIDECESMRFMYEESPQYEMGYVMGEIIERYRRTVEIAKLYIITGHKDPVFAMLYRMEQVQKMYFEAYHLVQMMHEIPRKYEYMPEFKDIFTGIDHDDLLRYNQRIEREKLRKAKLRKAMQKMYQKLTDTYAKSKFDQYAVRHSPPNKRWPLDYGWEIDHRW